MLYFRFNTEQFIAPTREHSIIPSKSEKPHTIEAEELPVGEVQRLFFQKLYTELAFEIGGISTMYDVIGIPLDAFSIEDEQAENLTGVISFALTEYTHRPIDCLNGKSLTDLGISIEFCKRIPTKKVNSMLQEYITKNNLGYLTEEVLWRNMTDEEQAVKFIEYLDEIHSRDSELIVVDAYLFNSSDDDYYNKLEIILRGSHAKSINFITNYRHCRRDKICSCMNRVGIPYTVTYSDDFHDRFWIANREYGFCTGTSLNGIGRKISLIMKLSHEDTEEIIKELQNQNLLSLPPQGESNTI